MRHIFSGDRLFSKLKKSSLLGYTQIINKKHKKTLVTIKFFKNTISDSPLIVRKLLGSKNPSFIKDQENISKIKFYRHNVQ